VDLGWTRAAAVTVSSASLPRLVRNLCDDAAVFPPGLVPLPEAVTAHQRYSSSWFAGMVGPLVLPVSALDGFLALEQPVPLCLTFPDGPALLPAALDQAAGRSDLRAVEIAVPQSLAAADIVPQIGKALDGHRVDVAVEVPRDARRAAVLDGLAGSPYRAKFRTGGVRADLYPGGDELAGSVLAAARAGVAFKATAGLHHAVRNTDPETGFEQHGFLNLILAADAAANGASQADVSHLLAERDSAQVATQIDALGAERTTAARRLFTSFGTCSVTDPLRELTALGLLTVPGEASVQA
jgi:hypothetical protein